MSAPRVVVCGYSAVGAVCLAELISMGAHVAALFTHEDSLAENIWFDTPSPVAVSAGVPVYTESLADNAGFYLCHALAPDIIFSFYYRDMLPQRVLNLPPMGAYNMHGSLLPRYRGRVPVHWAIINGEKRTGVTLHRMVARADAGDIVGQEAVPILPNDTSRDVMERMSVAAGVLIRRLYPAIADGGAQFVPQDERLVTKFGARRPADGLIDWRQSARNIYNLVRATTRPYPGAFSYMGGKKIYIWWGAPEEGDGTPGAVYGSAVQCGDGRLRLTEVQPEGERMLTGYEIESYMGGKMFDR